jgi:hypothetical protein
MKKILLLLMVLMLFSVSQGMAYQVYLKNGSVISDVSSYKDAGDEILIYFGTGTMVIPKKNLLKIEGRELPESSMSGKESGEVEQKQEKNAPAGGGSQGKAPETDKNAPVNAVKSELETVYSEIRTATEEENRLVAEVNEKSSKTVYNQIQRIQLEKDLEPLRQNLRAVQQRKGELLQKKYELETRLRALQ